MNDVIDMSFNAPRPISMNPVQRTVYAGLGFGIIVTSLIAEPISLLAMAAFNIAGIALVIAAIIGRSIRLSKLKMKGRKFGPMLQPLTNAILGVALSVAAFTLPGLSPAWMAVAHISATVLVISAILNMEFLLADRKHADIETLTSFEEYDDWSMADAA